MKPRHLICGILFFLSALKMQSQVCHTSGQTPVTAVLVCGSASLAQGTAEFCGQTSIPTPCNDGFPYQNTNPNYFRMACYSSGTLGFTISPNEAMKNYDWQLFDITNTNPESIFTIPSLFLACNWSSDPGETGANADGTSLSVCSGSGQPQFSQMPEIQQGRTYLLMVTNQGGSTAGYNLTFAGGTASITDAVEPELRSASLNCEGTKIIVRLNKKMLCSTFAGDGSDFSVTGGSNIISAMPGDCSFTQSSDSITLNLDQPLLVGSYTVSIKDGTDGNSILDVCHRPIPPGNTVPLEVIPLAPTPMDSIAPIRCKPEYFDLVFERPIRCNSIAADGTDFILSGPSAPSITGVTVECLEPGWTSIIRLNLSTAIIVGGIYQVTLRVGSDGNTLIDECGMTTPAGERATKMVGDMVDANFTVNIQPSCTENIVSFFHNGNSGVNNWKWELGVGSPGNIPNPVVKYLEPGTKNLSLTVSNGTCSITSTRTLIIPDILSADFESPEIACQENPELIIDQSNGDVNFWHWDFGNGNQSFQQVPPPQIFIAGSRELIYNIRLIAGNTISNCRDTVSKIIRVPVSCKIAVPSGFTPNNDGRNDYFYPLNAYKAIDLDFKVFDRNGQVVFATRDWTRQWDGTIRGVPQPGGVYAWFLRYTHKDTGQKVFTKGTTLLIR